MPLQAAGWHCFLSPSNPPRARGNVRDAIRDDGVAAAGTGMCRLRRPVRRWLWPEGNREAVRLAGVAFLLVTFLWPRKEKLLAPARRAGETLSRAQPSRPARRSRAANSQAHHIPMTRTSDYALLIEPTVLTKKEPTAPFVLMARALRLTAPQGGHTPSPATWRQRRRTGSAPGSAGRPLRS